MIPYVEGKTTPFAIIAKLAFGGCCIVCVRVLLVEPVTPPLLLY